MYDAGCKAAFSFHLARPQRLSNPEATLIVQELVRHSSDELANKHVIRNPKNTNGAENTPSRTRTWNPLIKSQML